MQCLMLMHVIEVDFYVIVTLHWLQCWSREIHNSCMNHVKLKWGTRN